MSCRKRERSIAVSGSANRIIIFRFSSLKLMGVTMRFLVSEQPFELGRLPYDACLLAGSRGWAQAEFGTEADHVGRRVPSRRQKAG